MSQYDQDFAAAGARQLLEYYGEPAVYTPPGDGATPRTISVIVHRGPVGSMAPGAQGLVPRLTFETLIDADDGILATEEPWKGGKLEVPRLAGGNAESFLIHRSDDRDAQAGGMLQLALR